ncbi:MAG: hypothetical protein M3380_08810 [Chloroflexota bacterium]|nr:hypothetical protein [Chloroflexota bacterium]
MTDLDTSGLHTPQHRPEQDPRPDPEPPQDQGESNEFLDQLAGRNVAETAYFDASDVEPLEGISMTDVYEGDVDSNQELVERGAEQFDLLVERELRAGETDDVMEAVEEGLTYVPPIDPPIVPDPDNLESVDVAAGFALDADELDSPPDLDRDSEDRFFDRSDDMTALVRRALRTDAATTHLADQLLIATINGTVIVRGTVDDLEDSDNIIAVISDLPWVESVRDETEVRGL